MTLDFVKMRMLVEIPDEQIIFKYMIFLIPDCVWAYFLFKSVMTGSIAGREGYGTRWKEKKGAFLLWMGYHGFIFSFWVVLTIWTW